MRKTAGLHDDRRPPLPDHAFPLRVHPDLGKLLLVKNERRKRRLAAVRLANAFEQQTRRFHELPLEERELSVAKAYVYNSSLRLHPTRCVSCGGCGFRERRGRPRAEVACRVCQGTGWIQRRVTDEAILGLRPSKAYWQGRRWWRHWRQ